jgi:methionyl-tRNA formyltransferase
MRIAFLGTPPFAVPPLAALAQAGHDVCCVVAQPDRPAGRGQELREPATKMWARDHGIPVLQPEKVRDGRLATGLRALSPDVLVVVAYGRILGRDLLELAPLGAVNVHASLLPRWRGAAPIQWAIAEGDRETGVTIMRMDEGLDTGDMLLQRVVPIGADDTSEALHDRLGRVGAEALTEALPLFAAGKLAPVKQDESQVTLAPIIEKEHGRIDFTMPGSRIACRVRGFTPWPGTFTVLDGKVLKVHAASEAPPSRLAPGEARGVPEGLLVGAGGGSSLLVTELQLEGKRRVAAAEFLKGQRIAQGTVLGR